MDDKRYQVYTHEIGIPGIPETLRDAITRKKHGPRNTKAVLSAPSNILIELVNWDTKDVLESRTQGGVLDTNQWPKIVYHMLYDEVFIVPDTKGSQITVRISIPDPRPPYRMRVIEELGPYYAIPGCTMTVNAPTRPLAAVNS